MRKYVISSLILLAAGGIGATLYLLCEPHLSRELSSIVMRSFLSVVFITTTLKLIDHKASLFQLKKLTREQLILTFSILSLFAVNNYLLANYGGTPNFAQGGAIPLVLVGFVVNSFFEEFTYRGFIQNYINQHTSKPLAPLSQGNIFSSILMTLTHLGFFQVMDTGFAISGILLVLVFSLTMGYLRDKGCSIWFLITTHTLVNVIHLLFNLDSYQ